MLRRAGGRIRFLPADLLARPALVAGLWLMLGLELITNRVAGGARTVRLVVLGPSTWLDDAWGWTGLFLIALGVALAIVGKARMDPRHWGMAVRYPAFASAGSLLAVGAVLSAWRAYAHISDIAPGGVTWRFQVVHRTHWGDDLTTAVLGVAALACYALSFGRRRWADLEAWDARQASHQAARERVPATRVARATTSRTMATGVVTHRRVSRGRNPSEDG